MIEGCVDCVAWRRRRSSASNPNFPSLLTRQAFFLKTCLAKLFRERPFLLVPPWHLLGQAWCWTFSGLERKQRGQTSSCHQKDSHHDHFNVQPFFEWDLRVLPLMIEHNSLQAAHHNTWHNSKGWNYWQSMILSEGDQIMFPYQLLARGRSWRLVPCGRRYGWTPWEDFLGASQDCFSLDK